MSVQLIAEKLLLPEHFLRATEQAEPYWPIPSADAGNGGALRPMIAGEPADFEYDGTTDSDGNVGGTTAVCSKLTIFGNDFFIGASIEITSGAYNGETRTVSDFAQATGTLTVSSAFGGQILSGVTFTLTIFYATRDFILELIAAGDPGGATFKWSHDGGITYLGRDDPFQTSWLGETDFTNNLAPDGGRALSIIETTEGNLVAIFEYGSPIDVQCAISEDFGLTWTFQTTIAVGISGDATIHAAEVLKSGRILVLIRIESSPYSFYCYYSDDEGATWAQMAATLQVGPTLPDEGVTDWVKMPDNSLYAVQFDSGDIYGRRSSSEGLSWPSSATAIVTSSNTTPNPSIALTANGNLICAYIDDDGTGNDSIKGVISEDNGATWGSEFTIIDYSVPGSDLNGPLIRADIDGTIYCIAINPTNDRIYLNRSTDNGENWDTPIILHTDASHPPSRAWISFVCGHLAICCYVSSDETSHHVRRGIWETYSANPCPTGMKLVKQYLIRSARLLWYGGAGIVGDQWTFEAGYDFSMVNLLEDSPSKPWRSEQDNVACEIVLDLGTIDRLWADGIVFFGCNLRSFNFQMNPSDSWGSPALDETISFDLTTGEVDAVSGYAIQDTSLLANYKDHELKGLYLRMTSGADDGETWKIKDNVGDYIFLELSSAPGYSASDTFVIYQRHISKSFTAGLMRYARLSIAAQQAAEGYYEIGAMIAGRVVTLSSSFSVGYSKQHRYDIEMQRTAKGGLIPIKGAERKRILQLSWGRSENTYKEVAALLDYIEEGNICLVPDSNAPVECYLVKLIGDLTMKNIRRTWFAIDSLTFEEVL